MENELRTEVERIEQNIENTYAVLAALGADMPETQNSDNLATTAGSAKAKIKKICDNVSLRTGDTALLGLDEIADAVLTIDGAVNTYLWVSQSVAATFPPVQKAASPDVEGYDIGVLNATADDIHAYIDEVVNGKKTVTKEILGTDASGKYDIARYIYANREHCAWVKKNYPKMYAWKNGATKMYTESVSPRVGDKAYAEPRIIESSTTTETVTVPPKAVLIKGYRYSHSGGAFSALASCASLVFPVEFTSANVSSGLTLVLNGATQNGTYANMYYSLENDGIFEKTGNAKQITTSKLTITGATGVIGKCYGIVFLNMNSSIDNLTITLDGVSMDVLVTTDTSQATKAAFASTTTIEVETEGGTPVTEVRVATVASGAATNTVPSSRMIGGVEYVRSAADDVEPTVIYTDVDDNRNSSASITQEGVTYYRYPLGDLGENRQKLIPIFIYANEHGIKPSRLNESDSMYQKYETKMCALVVARFLRDLADGKKIHNPLYKFIREKCMLIVIPVSNPFGYNMNVTGDTNPANDGYYNANNVNSNRNFDTPGWIISKNGGGGHHGDYPGSENETQYLMNTMVESGAVVAMSLHGIAGFFGGTQTDTGFGHCSHQGQNPDGSHYDKATMDKISNFLAENYGYKMVYYDRIEVDHVYDYEPPSGESVNLPDRSCKSPSYITQCGAYGGIVEFQPDDIHVSGYQQAYKGYIIENAYAQMLNLTAMWLSDYLDL